MSNQHHLLLLIIAILYCWSCNSDDSIETVKQYSKKALLTNLYSNTIIPEHQSFYSQTKTFDSTFVAYKNTSNTTTLNNLRNSWKETKSTWERLESFDIKSTKQLVIHNKIDKYPINITALENNLNSSKTLDKAFVQASGSTAKGLAAIEWLLFKKINQVDTISPKAIEYLGGQIDALNNSAELLLDTWANTKNSFITATDNTTSGSVNQLVNAQIELLEEIVNTKLGQPLGKNDGTPKATAVESPYAEYSLENIANNIKGIKQTIFAPAPSLGQQITNVQGNKILYDKLQLAFDDAIHSLEKPDKSLVTLIETNDPSVDTIYENTKEVLKLIKVDLSSTLSITVTFNDNDGD